MPGGLKSPGELAAEGEGGRKPKGHGFWDCEMAQQVKRLATNPKSLSSIPEIGRRREPIPAGYPLTSNQIILLGGSHLEWVWPVHAQESQGTLVWVLKANRETSPELSYTF